MHTKNNCSHQPDIVFNLNEKKNIISPFDNVFIQQTEYIVFEKRKQK